MRNVILASNLIEIMDEQPPCHWTSNECGTVYGSGKEGGCVNCPAYMIGERMTRKQAIKWWKDQKVKVINE